MHMSVTMSHGFRGVTALQASVFCNLDKYYTYIEASSYHSIRVGSPSQFFVQLSYKKNAEWGCQVPTTV